MKTLPNLFWKILQETSLEIQKEILNILATKVRNKIREEIGDAKFCILVDEALDEYNREQMAIVLRFVIVMGLFKSIFLMLRVLMKLVHKLFKKRCAMFLLITIFKLKICEVKGMMVLAI